MAYGIDELITPVTAEQVLASILSVAATLGLSTTSWQSGQPSRTILTLVANIIAQTLSLVSTTTAGAILDLAGTVTPEGGRGWLDFIVESGWSTSRRAATYAPVDITFTTTAACPGGVFAAGTLRVARGSIGYSNAASITIPTGAGTVTGSFTADVAGASGSSGVGTITTLVTTIVGCSCSNSAAAVGSDAEKNADLVIRCKAKWQAISMDGPTGAYAYNALTINGANQVAVTSGPLTQPSLPATRARTSASPSTGVVTTYVAHAAGAYSTPPNYTGNVARGIASSTFASPIQIATAAPHGYSTGDTVQIVGHTVNTGANGNWTIVVTGLGTYTLTGSVGVAVGGATGYGYRYSDLDLIDNSIHANTVPLTVTASTVTATAVPLTVVGVITVTGALSGSADAAITAIASTAVSDLASTIPIGGTGTSTVVYVDQIRAAVRDALGGASLVPSVAISSPAADLAIAADGVATVTVAPVFTVVRV